MLENSSQNTHGRLWGIGLILIGLLGSLYAYLSTPISRSELGIVNGTLKSLPKLGTKGGDFSYPYVLIQLHEKDQTVVVMKCAYESLNLSRLGNLSVGDSIRIEVVVSDDQYLAYAMQANGEDILAYRNYESCAKQSWKRLLYLTLILLIIFFVILGYRKWKESIL